MPTKSIDVIVNDRALPRPRPDLIQAIAPYLAASWQISHQITNPLTGIFDLTEGLISDERALSQDQLESIYQIEACAEQISQAIQTLFDTRSAMLDDDYVRNRIQAVLDRAEQFITGD